MDYEHYILQGEAKSTEFSDDRSYLLVQKANSYCACVGQTEECCLPKIVFTYDFGPLLYTCLDRCAAVLINEPILHRSSWSKMRISELKLLRSDPLYQIRKKKQMNYLN